MVTSSYIALLCQHPLINDVVSKGHGDCMKSFFIQTSFCILKHSQSILIFQSVSDKQRDSSSKAISWERAPQSSRSFLCILRCRLSDWDSCDCTHCKQVSREGCLIPLYRVSIVVRLIVTKSWVPWRNRQSWQVFKLYNSFCMIPKEGMALQHVVLCIPWTASWRCRAAVVLYSWNHCCFCFSQGYHSSLLQCVSQLDLEENAIEEHCDSDSLVKLMIIGCR